MEGDLKPEAATRRRKEKTRCRETESATASDDSSAALLVPSDTASVTPPCSHGDVGGAQEDAVESSTKRTARTVRCPSKTSASTSTSRSTSTSTSACDEPTDEPSRATTSVQTLPAISSRLFVSAKDESAMSFLWAASSRESLPSSSSSPSAAMAPPVNRLSTAPPVNRPSTAPSTTATTSYNLLSAAAESEDEQASRTDKSSLGSTATEQLVPTGFHDLPENVLVAIFSYFPEKEVACRLSPVCRGWRAAARHPSLWLHLAFRGARVPTASVCRLLRMAPLLRALRLDAVPNAATVVRQLCRCNPEVESVTIRNCTFGKDDLIQETVFRNLIVCCPKIVTLDLKGTQFSAFRFYQEIIKLPRLRSLNVGGNRYLKVQNLTTLALNCKGLQELKVARRPPPPPRQRAGFGRLGDSDAVCILTHLKASLISLKLDAAGLGDATLLAILKCSHLRELGLLNAREFSGDTMRLLEENLEKLVSLKLTYPCQMKPCHFRYLFSGQTSSLRNLVKLSLIACWELQDVGLQAVVDTCRGCLQSLSLKSCKTLTPKGLRHVVHHCRQLKRLNVAYAMQSTPGYLYLIPENLPQLQKLTVDAAYRKGPGLAELHAKMPGLSIALSHSEFGSEEVLLAF